jgi:hypothetical protein
MTFIADLAPYDYYGDAPEALAVGWLDATREFTTGTCPQDVVIRLADLVPHPVRIMRGYHYCQFCWAVAGPPVYAEDNPDLIVSHDDIAHGTGELWFTAPDDTHYAAPTPVVHYIDIHAYLPPTAFMRAVRDGWPTVGLT